MLDYYNPDEAKQYSEAQRDLTYNLARAGTLQSSTAADKPGDLAYNDALQKANIVANANHPDGQSAEPDPGEQGIADQSALRDRRSDADREPGRVEREGEPVAGPDADAGGGVVHAGADLGWFGC